MTREQFISCIAILFATIKTFVDQYLFCDWVFFIYLSILVWTDLGLGVWKHYKLETISSKGFGRAIEKFILYGIVLILAHVLSRYTVNGERNVMFLWMPNVLYGILVVKETISIFENIGVISPNLIPKWLLKKLKEYDSSGKFKK